MTAPADPPLAPVAPVLDDPTPAEEAPHAGVVALEVLVASLLHLVLAAALTWPTAQDLGGAVIGGGELGGWLWRQWWHFKEVEALAAADLGVYEHLQGLVALGRYPETGNILDVLLLSYPLDQLVGFPAHHNLKVWVVLVGNGLCAYVLARTFTPDRAVALAASAVAVANPLVIQDVNATGLRQVLLWWLLLYPVVLQRAGRTCRALDGALVGVVFALVATFYWFYGLFAVMLTGIWLAAWWNRERPTMLLALPWLASAALVAGVGVFFFLLPYFAAGAMDGAGSSGGMTDLPELTFFLPYPAYDTVAAAPLRPSTYQENVLASLHRVIDSSWSADFVLNPAHGVKAWPLAVVVLGVGPLLVLRKARTWLTIWMVFYVGTLGPFLKVGALKDTADVVMVGDYVVRLPWVWMFQFIPGMSRMFAPYRLASVLVVASVVLLALGLTLVKRRYRTPLALLALVTIVVQPFYRFDMGPLANESARPSSWRVPTTVSEFTVPAWYQTLDDTQRQGIVELPMDQQQDLLTAYQAFHHQKVYRSWATDPAVPPQIRRNGGGEAGKLLRWLARAEIRDDRLRDTLTAQSSQPLEVDLGEVSDEDLVSFMESGPYRWIVVHERGYYLVDPRNGGTFYRDAVRRWSERLAIEPDERVEYGMDGQTGGAGEKLTQPAWVPLASKEVNLPFEEMPSRYMMAAFDLEAWLAARPPEGFRRPW